MTVVMRTVDSQEHTGPVKYKTIQKKDGLKMADCAEIEMATKD